MTDWINNLFAAIDGKDAAAFAAFLAEDVHFRYGSQEPVLGKAAVRAAAEGIFEMFAALSHEIAEAWIADAAVFCEGQVTYTLPDGRTVTLPFLNVFRMTGAGGPAPDEKPLIADYRIYIDPTPLATM